MYKYYKFLDLDLSWLDENSELKLCYVTKDDDRRDKDGYIEYYGFTLYFTPIALKEQWGDDWDDAPYDCNAGCPYDVTWKEGADGKYHRYEHTIYMLRIYVKAEERPFLPEDGEFNSPYSVDMINSRAAAWMYFRSKELKACAGIAVLAGMSPREVYNAIGEYMVNPDESILKSK